MTRLSSLRIAVMVPRACLGLLLLLSPCCVWSQADTNGTEAATNPGDDVPMRTPPPVSGGAYSTAFASETESNYLRVGLTVSPGYTNNVVAGLKPVGSAFY